MVVIAASRRTSTTFKVISCPLRWRHPYPPPSLAPSLSPFLSLVVTSFVVMVGGGAGGAGGGRRSFPFGRTVCMMTVLPLSLPDSQTLFLSLSVFLALLLFPSFMVNLSLSHTHPPVSFPSPSSLPFLSKSASSAFRYSSSSLFHFASSSSSSATALAAHAAIVAAARIEDKLLYKNGS